MLNKSISLLCNEPLLKINYGTLRASKLMNIYVCKGGDVPQFLRVRNLCCGLSEVAPVVRCLAKSSEKPY